VTQREQIFAIGDIHGCFDELQALINSLPLNASSTLIFLGDYVDRGPKSKEVIDYILHLKTKYNVIALKGNHEAMMLDFLNDPSSAFAGLFVLNGGSSTLASYSNDDKHFNIPHEHKKFLATLPYYYETENYFFVHAGVPDVSLDKIEPIKHALDLLWIRTPFYDSKFKWEKTIVHGHTPQKEIFISDKRINIDTACVFEGKLTAMEMSTQKVWQINYKSTESVKYLKDTHESTRVARRFDGKIPVYILIGNLVEEFLTLNYSEFGLLLQDLKNRLPCFEVGDIVSGNIGPKNGPQLRFRGEIVRSRQEDGCTYYGVKMHELDTVD